MRGFEESTALIDQIVGRCVRDPEFARSVIEDPRAALAEYGLNEGEEADFTALSEQVGAAALGIWSDFRATFSEALGAPGESDK